MLRLRVLLPLIFALAYGSVFCQQINDDFNDGDFTSGPHVWSGDDTEWTVVGNRLNINASVANVNNYLSTPFAVPSLDSASWEFDIEFTVATATTNNFAEVFLISDLQDVDGNVNGYFVRVNNNQQEISLWRSSNGSNSKIIDGADGVTASNLAFRIRVTRSASGDWALFHDATVTGTNYTLEGTVNDITFTSSAYFGVLDRHSAASRNQWLFLDNINVEHFSNPDLTPPTILGLNVTASTQLEVQFDEFVDVATATTLSNYDANGQTPTAATVSATDSALVVLDFATAFGNCVTETLTVQNVADRSANVMLQQALPYIYCVTPPAAFRDVVINEIFADPTPVVCGHPNAEFVELYNRGTNPVNLKDWTISDGTPAVITTQNYILTPGSYLILSDSGSWSAFGPTLAMNLQTLTNSGETLVLRDNGSALIDSVTFSDTQYAPGRNDGYSLELINPDAVCYAATSNWSSSSDTCRATPGAQNAIYDPTPDTQAPSISSVTVTGTNTLQVCFDEALDSSSATVPGSYAVTGIGQATAATPVGPGFTCVDLTLPGNINPGTLYTLFVNGVQDCPGNTTNDSIDFLESGPASPKDVIINEIYPILDPGNLALPNTEYVELYNRSNTIYNLSGWTFSDRGSPKVLGSFTLQPGAYVILCHQDSVGLFGGLPVLGVASFPSLNNTDDDLGLRDGTGMLVDSVQYTDDDFQDPDKDSGGWSLELINPEDTCSQLGNWIASNDVSGGTPGAQNSVYDASPDVTGPVLLQTSITGPNTIELCFDETMSIASLLTLTNYTIDNGMGNPVAAVPGGTGLSCVELTLAMAIDTGTIYTVNFTVEDCKGNASALNTTFVQGGAALPFQVVINEIFPNESPSVGLPEREFVELYNNGPNAVDLRDWTFTDGSSTATLPGYTLLPDEYVILCASSYAGQFSSFGPTLGLSSFPTLNQSADNLELYDAGNTLIDYVYYDDDWYQDDTKSDGGWTLERIDPAFECLNADNWRASVDASGGTPGRVNSIRGTFTDPTPPTLVTAHPTANGTMVHVEFSEIMDEFSLLATNQYSIDNGINILGVLTNGPTSTGIDLMLQNTLQPRVVYCLTVNGVLDCAGNAMVNQTICFGLSEAIEPGDLVINEILFNPRTGGSDYVELYNVSDKVLDLSTLQISRRALDSDSLYSTDQVAQNTLLVLPGAYICLTENKQFQLDTYQPIDPDAIFETDDLPSFGETEDICVIHTDSVTVIDMLYYLDDWHFPNLDDDDGVSLERIDFNRPTQDQNNWHSAASTVNYGTPGYRNSEVLVPAGDNEVWLQPETFSPDQDGRDDHLSINYKFPTQGWNVKASVFDNKGRLIKIVSQNFLAGTEDAEGTIKWDGTNETGNKAPIGVYVVLVEASNPNTGETKTYKLGCVLAAVLN